MSRKGKHVPGPPNNPNVGDALHRQRADRHRGRRRNRSPAHSASRSGSDSSTPARHRRADCYRPAHSSPPPRPDHLLEPYPPPPPPPLPRNSRPSTSHLPPTPTTPSAPHVAPVAEMVPPSGPKNGPDPELLKQLLADLIQTGMQQASAENEVRSLKVKVDEQEATLRNWSTKKNTHDIILKPMRESRDGLLEDLKGKRAYLERCKQKSRDACTSVSDAVRKMTIDRTIDIDSIAGTVLELVQSRLLVRLEEKIVVVQRQQSTLENKQSSVHEDITNFGQKLLTYQEKTNKRLQDVDNQKQQPSSSAQELMDYRNSTDKRIQGLQNSFTTLAKGNAELEGAIQGKDQFLNFLPTRDEFDILQRTVDEHVLDCSSSGNVREPSQQASSETNINPPVTVTDFETFREIVKANLEQCLKHSELEELKRTFDERLTDVGGADVAALRKEMQGDIDHLQVKVQALEYVQEGLAIDVDKAMVTKKAEILSEVAASQQDTLSQWKTEIADSVAETMRQQHQEEVAELKRQNSALARQFHEMKVARDKEQIERSKEKAENEARFQRMEAALQHLSKDHPRSPPDSSDPTFSIRVTQNERNVSTLGKEVSQCSQSIIMLKQFVSSLTDRFDNLTTEHVIERIINSLKFHFPLDTMKTQGETIKAQSVHLQELDKKVVDLARVNPSNVNEEAFNARFSSINEALHKIRQEIEAKLQGVTSKDVLHSALERLDEIESKKIPNLASNEEMAVLSKRLANEANTVERLQGSFITLSQHMNQIQHFPALQRDFGELVQKVDKVHGDLKQQKVLHDIESNTLEAHEGHIDELRKFMEDAGSRLKQVENTTSGESLSGTKESITDLDSRLTTIWSAQTKSSDALKLHDQRIESVEFRVNDLSETCAEHGNSEARLSNKLSDVSREVNELDEKIRTSLSDDLRNVHTQLNDPVSSLSEKSNGSVTARPPQEANGHRNPDARSPMAPISDGNARASEQTRNTPSVRPKTSLPDTGRESSKKRRLDSSEGLKTPATSYDIKNPASPTLRHHDSGSKKKIKPNKPHIRMALDHDAEESTDQEKQWRNLEAFNPSEQSHQQQKSNKIGNIGRSSTTPLTTNSDTNNKTLSLKLKLSKTASPNTRQSPLSKNASSSLVQEFMKGKPDVDVDAISVASEVLGADIYCEVAQRLLRESDTKSREDWENVKKIFNEKDGKVKRDIKAFLQAAAV